MTRPRRGRSGDSATFVRWFWQFLPYCAKSLSHELFDLSRSACLCLPSCSPALSGERAGERAFRPDVRPFKMMLQVCVCDCWSVGRPSLARLSILTAWLYLAAAAGDTMHAQSVHRGCLHASLHSSTSLLGSAISVVSLVNVVFTN